MFSIFSLVEMLKFPLTSLEFLDTLMTSDMLSIFDIFFEVSYLRKSTFGLGTAACNILLGETLWIASAKSFILNGFKSQFFSGSNLFFSEATNSVFFSSLAKILSTEI